MSEEKEFTVWVTYIGEEDYEDLSDDDHLSEGDYGYTGTDEDDVLDKFHDDHPIGNLELYDIEVTESGEYPKSEERDKLMSAIDDIHTSLQVNGKQSDTTDTLVNYLTANVDDIIEAMDEEDWDEEEEEWE